VTVEGAVEPNESRQIAALLATLVDIGARQLFVDLARVDTCDPDLPEFLNDLRRRMTSLGGWVIVDRSPTTLGDDTLALTSSSLSTPVSPGRTVRSDISQGRTYPSPACPLPRRNRSFTRIAVDVAITGRGVETEFWLWE
jgi:hypothetical protein